MKKTSGLRFSLCFSSDGLLNPEAIDHIVEYGMDAVALFSDGSQGAFEHMRRFDTSCLKGRARSIGVAKVPLYEIRVIAADGTVSKPHYAYSEEVRIKWLCSKIFANYINITVSDITSPTSTQVKLDRPQVEDMCYASYSLWYLLRVAEDRLCFPAIAIDRMTRWTHKLTANTIDIPLLRKESGLHSLDYNSQTDLLTITVGGDIFSVKLSVLDKLYGEMILPLFNKMLGRRLRIRVSIAGASGQYGDPVDMSYGELGRYIDEMKSYAKEKLVTTQTPMDTSDFLTFAKKVRINEESCLWPSATTTIADLIDAVHDNVIARTQDDDLDHNGPVADPVGHPEPAHV